MVGTGKGAEHGVIIKSGVALETAHKIKTIVFDKTGTITEGNPKVTDIVVANGISEEYLLQIAASGEKGSEHPLGESIVKGAEERKLEFKKVEFFKAIPGHGIEVKIDGKKNIVKKNIKAGDNSINIGSFKTTGEQKFSIIATDKYGRNSHELFNN